MEMQKSKKGFSIGDMPALVITFVVVAIVVALGAIVGANFQSTQAPGTATAENYTNAAYNVTIDMMSGMSTFSDYLPIIAIVLTVVVILGLLYMLLRKAD